MIFLVAGIAGIAVGAFSFMGMHTFLYHFILLVTPIIMLVTGYYKPKFEDLRAHLTLMLVLFPPFCVPDFFYIPDFVLQIG